MQFTLLNTRPEHQAAALNEMVKQAGGQVMNCPTLQIVPKPNALQSLNNASQQAFDGIIFISANAVEQFVKQNTHNLLTSVTAATQMYAIGKATAKKGLQLGLSLQTLSKTKFDSEAFLASPEMLNVIDTSILIVKGEGGRDLLEKTLLERGAQVKTAELYSRRPLEFCKATWSQFIKQTNPVLLVTSLASWQVIYRSIAGSSSNIGETDLALTVGRSHEGLPNKLLTVVMSQRIARYIQEQKWPYAVKVIDNQTNEGILQAIQEELRLN